MMSISRSSSYSIQEASSLFASAHVGQLMGDLVSQDSQRVLLSLSFLQSCIDNGEIAIVGQHFGFVYAAQALRNHPNNEKIQVAGTTVVVHSARMIPQHDGDGQSYAWVRTCLYELGFVEDSDIPLDPSLSRQLQESLQRAGVGVYLLKALVQYTDQFDVAVLGMSLLLLPSLVLSFAEAVEHGFLQMLSRIFHLHAADQPALMAAACRTMYFSAAARHEQLAQKQEQQTEEDVVLWPLQDLSLAVTQALPVLTSYEAYLFACRTLVVWTVTTRSHTKSQQQAARVARQELLEAGLLESLVGAIKANMDDPLVLQELVTVLFPLIRHSDKFKARFCAIGGVSLLGRLLTQHLFQVQVLQGCLVIALTIAHSYDDATIAFGNSSMLLDALGACVYHYGRQQPPISAAAAAESQSSHTAQPLSLHTRAMICQVAHETAQRIVLVRQHGQRGREVPQGRVGGQA